MHLIRAPFNAGITANSTWLLSRFLSTCNSRVIFICILLVSVSHHHRLSLTFLHKLLSPSQFLWFYLFSRIIQLKRLKCQEILSICLPSMYVISSNFTSKLYKLFNNNIYTFIQPSLSDISRVLMYDLSLNVNFNLLTISSPLFSLIVLSEKTYASSAIINFSLLITSFK